MACGTAVVASSCGQISEVVRDGENGLLVPPGNLGALAGACDRLLTEPALRQRLGQSASELIRREFTWNENAARVVALARQHLSDRTPRANQHAQRELAAITIL
jgi:glycosyltransferase involved in cell wall biosynthesis